MDSKKIKVSKQDAARRQINSAITLYFLSEDPVSTHTLACVANGILKGFGTPYYDEGAAKFYIYQSHMIGVVFDDNGICQAVAVYNFQKQINNECDMFDPIILPARKHNRITIPKDQIPTFPQGTISDAYVSFGGNDMLFVIDAYYQTSGRQDG